MMDILRFSILRVLAVYWTISAVVGLLNVNHAFDANTGAGLGYLIFMLLLGGSNAFLFWSLMRGRQAEDVYLAFYGFLNAFVAVGLLIMRLAIFRDVYSIIATSEVQVNMMIVLFGATAFLSLVHNSALDVRHLFKRVPAHDPKDDSTYINIEQLERLNQLDR